MTLHSSRRRFVAGFEKKASGSYNSRRDSPVSYLAILVDERGGVVDLYWDIPTEIPWLPTNQCLRQN